jgi:hypothetical protein
LKLNKDLRISLFLALFAVVLTLFTYRPIFSGQLIGDPFDSRLMIVIHEHWWRWLNGLTDFRDLGFFYPYNTTLGFSDVFLIPGILYSFFRALNFGLAESWTIVTFIVLIIGNLGWTVIAKRFINNNVLRIIFVATIITSFSFTAYFAINPNIVGYSLLSWFAMLIYSIEKEKNSVVKQRKIAIFVILLLIFALSYWYGAFFVGFLILVRLLVGLIYRSKGLIFRNSLAKMKTLDRVWLLAIPIIIFFIWLFYYVYISVASEPFRSKSEMVFNSPSITMLLNAGSPTQYGLKNQIFGPIYQFLGFDLPFENLIGLGLAVTFVGLVSLTFVARQGERLTRLWLLTLVFTFLYFAKLFNNNSIHSYLFDIVPGLNSIRYPGRFIIVLSFALIFISFKLLDSLLRNKKFNFTKVFLYLIAILLLVDQTRGPFSGWNAKLLINKNLFSQVEEIKNNCDYFYFSHPGGWWSNQIKAMVFSVQIGIPTVNGYSGAFPSSYPVQEWNSNLSSNKILDWISKIDSSEQGCFVTDVGNFEHFVTDEIYVDYVGFTPSESNGEVTWNWAVNENPYLYAFSSKRENISIGFELEISPCFESQLITIKDSSSGEILEKIQVTKEEEIKLNLNFSDVYSKQILFSTDAGICKIEGDPRGLYFNVKNLDYQLIP